MKPIDIDLIAKGRLFEFEVAGVTVKDNTFKKEDYATFRDARAEVIRRPIIETDTREIFYFPENPNRGMLPVLFKQVQMRLRQRLGDTNKAKRVLSQLRLYIAINTKLDIFHGVDIFFTFRGADVLLDITLSPSFKKDWRLAVNERLADNRMLLTVGDVEEGFRSLGEKVSNYLFSQYSLAEKQRKQDILTAEFLKQKITRKKWDMIRAE